MNGGGRWLSRNAVLWVLYDAPDVPARLLSTLLVLAAFTGTDGCGAHPSAATIAMLTRKSERQVKRDIGELVKLGLLLHGNQRIVAHIRADRRPVVYDLPMPVDNPARGDTHDTPQDGHGVTPMTGRGDRNRLHGVSPVTPEKDLNRSGKARGRASANGARARAAQPCDRDGPGSRSDACRRGQSSQCGYAPPDGWCACRCHPKAVTP